MKVNLDVEFKDLSGKVICKDKDLIGDGKGEPFTLKSLCIAAALSPPDKENREPVTPDKAVERWMLAQRLNTAEGEVEITPEEASFLRKRIPNLFGIVLSGQACAILKG